MNASGPESVSSAIRQAEVSPVQVSQQINNPGLGIETQAYSSADIASARSFFVPKAGVPPAPFAGIEHSGVAVIKAVEGAISPMLQLIMRLPGHLGLFSSFLEAFKNLFFSHDLLSNFNLGDIASGVDLTHVTGLHHITHLGHAAGALPSSLHAFQNMSTEMVSSIGTAHLHINPFDSLKQSMNLSSGIDIRNPQFEGIHASATGGNLEQATSGDNLAGPGLSGQAITPKLAPAERIFNSKSFESVNNNYSNASNLLAFNSQPPATSITSGASSATGTNLSNLNQTPSNSNGQSTSFTPNPESTTPQISSNMPGLQAKALSLENVIHGGHSHISTTHALVAGHKHFSNSPFSKLASNTRQTFQSAQRDMSIIASQSYSIKSGDSLWQIANRELGSGGRWRDIYNLNQDKLGSNPGLIHSGTSISLPESGATPGALSSTSLDHSMIAHKPLTNHYTVKSGDNLWQISKNVFGSGDKWTQLYKFNGSTIGGNPRMIFSGQKLALSGTVNSIHPQLPTHNAEQLAHHVVPSSPVTHNSSTLAHVQHSTVHNPVIHEQYSVTHNQSIIAHEQHSIDHYKLQYQSPVSDNRIAQAPIHQPAAHGLTVQEAHDQLLSGAGGAQAATNSHPVSNKLSGVNAAKGKSVVSFSLAPDLAQW